MESWRRFHLITAIAVALILNCNALKDQPRLETRNGHLYIIAADSHNISLLTSQGGTVNLNGENLIHIVSAAKKAASVVQNIEASLLMPLEERLNALAETVNGPNGLVQTVAQLQTSRTNFSEASSTSGGFLPSYVKVLRARIQRLSKTVRVLKRLLETDDCLSNPCQNGGTCTDMYDGFHCHCTDQWEGAQCTVDVNECARFGGTEFGCQNGATCVNTPGSYMCSCAAGYHGMRCTSKQLKCTAGSSRELCGHGTCLVPEGGMGDPGFICICETGWEKDGYACTKDIDECKTYRGVCSQNPPVKCHNVPGSYYCEHCPAGYSGDGYLCMDIDECAVNNGGCSLLPKVACINSQGSRTCGPCPPGYMGDGVTCTYAGGACHVNNGGCHPSARCFQMPGVSNSFVQCTCPEGYTGNGIGQDGCFYTGLTLHVCSPNPCKNGGECQKGFNNAFYCQCPLQFTGSTCEIELDPCNPNPCKNGGSCLPNKNYIPKSRFEYGPENYYRCNCLAGYTGSNCESVTEECGGGPSAVEQGEVRYPLSASHHYEGDRHCTWILYAKNDSQVLNITFTSFDLESSANCKSDYIQIYDGIVPYGQVVGRNRFCGKTPPAPFQAVHNQVSITFHSDKSVSGDGFAFNYTAVQPACGWEKYVLSNGQISSPGSPGHYPPNKNCFYILRSKFGKRLQLNFFSLDIEESANCTKDYLRVWDGEEIPLEKYCGRNNLPNPIASLTNEIKIEFHSDAEGSGSGFQIAYNIIAGSAGCGGTLTGAKGQIVSPNNLHTMGQTSDKLGDKYADNLHCEWLIQVPKNQRIRIYFTKFALEGRGNKKCLYDKLQILDGGDARARLIGKWCGNQLPPVIETTGNLALVEFMTDNSVSDEGFRLVYEIICGGVLNEPEGTFTSPMYPNHYLVDHECSYLIEQPVGKVIKLQFLDFDVFGIPTKTAKGLCLGDYIRVLDGDSKNSTKIGDYCGETRPPLITSSQNYLRIDFLSTKFRTARGFLANYSTIDIACGGILKARTGQIQSPVSQDKQGKYPHNMYCTWVIVAPVGHVVQLSWSHFSLEPSTQRCVHDYVEVFDNATTPGMGGSLNRYCGRVVPPLMTSSDNVVTVIFRTDSSMANEGFLANYIMKNASLSCGGNYLSPFGVIKSPNHPNPYPPNRQCTWLIQTRNNQQIRLRIHHFKLDSNPQCLRDYLEIRNGGSEHSPLIGKFCGTTIPEEILSLGNQLFLKFNSHSLTFGGGFNITWDGSLNGCGGEIMGVSGAIHSPNYPQPYGNNAECFYKVSVSRGSRVQLTIVDLQLENSKDCRLDYIQVYDGPSEKYPLIGKFCNIHPPNILSKSNQLYIKFRSDNTVEYRGFYLSYKTVCDGVVATGFRGVIESPNFPSIYEPSANCSWTIRAPQGNKINISFSHFDLGRLSRYSRRFNCSILGFVEISTKDSKNLESDDSREGESTIGSYCGDSIPEPITTTGNIATITFVTKLRNWYRGFRLEWAIHGCGGELSDRLSGEIHSPGYPNPYEHQVSCEWRISVPAGNSIQFNITDFNLEHTFSCYGDYLEIFGGPDDQSPSLSKLCAVQPLPIVLSSSNNHLFVRFNSDASYSSRGFFATYKTIPEKCGGTFTGTTGRIFSRNYPKHYEKTDDCIWLIQTKENHLVNITFDEFNLDSTSNCSSDFVTVYDGPSLSDPVLLVHCGNKPPPYVLSTGNSLTVRHKSKAASPRSGFAATYEMACGGNLIATDDRQFLSYQASHHKVNSRELYKNCTWYISADSLDKRVTVSFSKVDINDFMSTNGSCNGYGLSFYDGEDEGNSLLEICGSKMPPQIVSTGSKMLLKFFEAWYTDVTSQFVLTYSSMNTECGGNLTGEHGVIMSRDYPSLQQPDSECVWNIHGSPGVNVVLTLTVPCTSSALDASAVDVDGACGEDYLEVRAGSASGDLLGLYCCANPPTSALSANHLWVKFELGASNVTNHELRFTGSFQLSHMNEVSGRAGVITSPLFPNFYPRTGTFEWRITVQFGQVIILSFPIFQMETTGESSASENNYLQIFDGFDQNAPSLLKQGGSVKPNGVRSTGNVMYLRMMAEGYITQGSRFQLAWTAEDPVYVEDTTIHNSNISGCGGSMFVSRALGMNGTARFTSPWFPEGYDGPWNCTWLVETSPGYKLQLQFTTLDLEVTENCESDYVQVSTQETDSNEMKVVGKYCAKPESRYVAYTYNTRRLQVTFITDYYINKTGFSAVVSAVCGGELEGPEGEISTWDIDPDQRLALVSNFVCEWHVKVKPGRTIQVRFDKIDIPQLPGKICGSDYVLLKNGETNASPNLGNGKYCGNTAPVLPDTSSNHLYVKYPSLSHTKGFKLRYQEISENCGTKIVLTITNDTRTISSPNYPNTPDPHSECIWEVTAPPGQSIHIDFLEKLTSPHPECVREYIELRDGGTSVSHLIGRYCSSTPSFKITSGNMLWIKFFTDEEATMDKFRIKISLNTCGGTFYSPQTGLIESPNYPENYPLNVTCLWRLVAPPSHAFTITFPQLQLRSSAATVAGSQECNTSPDVLQVAWQTTEIDQEQSEGSNNLGKSSTYLDGNLFSNETTRICNQNYSPTLVVRPPVNEVFIKFQSSPNKIATSFSSLPLHSIPAIHPDTPPRSNVIHRLQLLQRLGIAGSGPSWGRSLFSPGPAKFAFLIEFNHTKQECRELVRESSGTIQSPNYPSPGHQEFYYCSWKIVVPKGRRVTLKIIDLDLDESPKGSSKIWGLQRLTLSHSLESYAYRIAMLTGSNHTGDVFESTSNTMMITFAVNKRTPNRGFKLTFNSESPSMCGGVVTSSSGVISTPDTFNLTSFVCDWEMLKNRTGTTMMFKLSGYVGINKPGECYYTSTKLTFYHDEDEIEVFCSNYEKPVIILSPFSVTKFKGYKSIYILSPYIKSTAIKDISYRIEYKEMPCGGILNGPEHELVKPRSVNGTDVLIGCAWQAIFPEEQTIEVTFVEFNLNLNCDEEYIVMHNGPYPNSPTLGKWCGANVPKPLTSQTNKLWIEYHSKVTNKDGRFKIKLSPSSRGCGGIHHGASGEVMSPGFPSKYMPNTECDWDLRAEPGYRIVVKFIDRFYLEASKDCQKDYVKVYFWKNKEWIEAGQVCGRDAVNKEIETQSSRVRIVFHSDETNQGDGFKAFWETKCGGIFTEPQGQIMSPNYPRKYANQSDCEYQILAPGKIIRGSFLDFDLEEDPDCRYDNLTYKVNLVDGSYAEVEPRVFCGTNRPPPITAQSELKIRFRSDWIKERSGFLFSYTVDSCGGEIKEPSTISTPKNGESYLQGLKCIWNITAPENKIITVTFHSFDVETSMTCRYDSLSAWQVVDGTESLLGTYCGHETPQIVRSQQNKMNLIFVSDETNSFDGFTATVHFTYGPKVGCGGSIFVGNEDKTISAPDIGNNNRYESFLDCNWHFTTTEGYILEVDFDLVKLDVCKNCECDYIELNDGTSRIGRFCETPQFKSIATVSNEVFIRFKSDNINNTGPGFRLKLTRKTSECGPSALTVQNNTQILTSPGYPAACKPGLRCLWSIRNPGNFIKLQYLDMDIEPAERCEGDHLKVIGIDYWTLYGSFYSLRSTDEKQQFYNFCGRKKNVPDTLSSSPTVKLAFICSADRPPDSRGSRFKIAYSSSECSRNFTGMEFGHIKHVGNVKDCGIIITAPNPNDTVSLYFREVAFVRRDCTSKLAVYDGLDRNARLLETSCGGFEKKAVSSTGSALYVHVSIPVEDPESHRSLLPYKPSVDLSFTTTSRGRGCGGRMVDYSGAIASPFFGTNVRNNSECEWDISIPVPHQKIKLVFIDFNIGSKALCSTDYLEVFDVNGDGELNSRAKFCGGDFPGALICETGHVIVKYVSSVNNAGTGWYMLFNVFHKID